MFFPWHFELLELCTMLDNLSEAKRAELLKQWFKIHEIRQRGFRRMRAGTVLVLVLVLGR